MSAKSEYSLRTIVVGLLISLIGCLLIIASYQLPDKSIITFTVGSIGTTFITVGVISFLYEVFLRQNFKSTIRTELTKLMNTSNEDIISKTKSELATVPSNIEASKLEIIDRINKQVPDNVGAIKKAIEQAMPPKYSNLKRVGLVDAYEFLDSNQMKEKIDALHNDEFLILKMWSPTINNLEASIVEAINQRNCNFKIALVDPNADEVILKRAASLIDYDSGQVVFEIQKNIKRIHSIYKRLKDKTKLEFRVYDSFVSIALYGYSSKFVMGLYLHNRLSEEGIQLKISGKNCRFYSKLAHHFDSVWEGARVIDFNNQDDLTHLGIKDSATNNVHGDHAS